VKRALLFLKGGIGDVVFTLPLLADLRAGWPGVELWVLTHAQGKGVLDLCPDVARTLSYGDVSAEPKLQALRAALDGQRFDAALTPVRSPRAAWVLWRSHARMRVGFGGGPEALLYTHRAPVRPFEVTFSRRFERLAAAAGVPPFGRPAPLTVSPERRARALDQLRLAGWDGEEPLVSIHVGGGWPTKQWPVEHAASLAALLARRHGLRTLLIGGASDRARAETVAAASGGAALVQVGNAVDEALAQMDVCTAAVGVDSGLSHAGAALGVPTVSLFGPNDPASILLAPHQRLLVQEALPCRPCNRLGKIRCPLGHHRCMRDTTVAQVLSALEPLLALGEVRLRAQASAPAPH
jgi:lipopolysaccharide heptosyltransferase II